MSLNILVVDDNPADRTLVRRYISGAARDVHVTQATTAAEALVALKSAENIDCVFLDYSLPDTDGISVLKQVFDKDLDVGPFPIVMLTGYGHESVIIDAIRYGAQDYLVKSNISPDTLYIAMTKAREVFELKKRGNEDKAVMVHTQKMKAVGQLTGGIAHDFNNLMTIIFGNTRLLETFLESEQAPKELCLEKVRTIQKATRRGVDLIKRLMLFSRHTGIQPQIVDVNQLIGELRELLCRTLGDFVEVKTELASDVHPINIDPGQLEHVLINMAVNARDAMVDGGVLTLKTENVSFGREAAVEHKVVAGDYVCLSVSDTGTGIPENVQGQIFEPFFTTKPVGKGTGLGLSMVFSFVKQSGGAIAFETRLNEGTTFKIYLPKAEAQENEGAANQNADEIALVKGGHETVLVVEDEEDIRTLARIILQGLGYTVLEAGTGREAIDLVLNHKGHIDLLFSDITMPGEMNGVQAAARIKDLRSDIKLLFATGYLADGLPDMDLAYRYPVIQKPYEPDDMAAIIRKILDSEEQPV